MERSRRHASKVQDFQTFHLSGDIIQGTVAATVQKLESPAKASHIAQPTILFGPSPVQLREDQGTTHETLDLDRCTAVNNIDVLDLETVITAGHTALYPKPVHYTHNEPAPDLAQRHSATNWLCNRAETEPITQ